MLEVKPSQSVIFLVCLAVAIAWLRSYGDTVIGTEFSLGSNSRAISVSSSNGAIWIAVLRSSDDWPLEQRQPIVVPGSKAYSSDVICFFPVSIFPPNTALMADDDDSVNIVVKRRWHLLGLGNAELIVNDSIRGLRRIPRTIGTIWRIPYWPIYCAAFVPCLIFFRNKLIRLMRCYARKCIECGYDLRATSRRCPECGRLLIQI